MNRKNYFAHNKRREIGFIGLGKMGKNMVQRLNDRGWRVVIYDKENKTIRETERKGIKGVDSIENLVKKILPPRIVWLMLPAGNAVEQTLFSDSGLIKFLKKGDIIIDGGNSFYLDSIRRYKKLTREGVEFVDTGVSGGPGGAKLGACLMVGGKQKIFNYLKPLFCDLAKKEGLQFFKGAGAGHFVKMVHNGIEYGMMQAIAEGFNLLKNSEYKLYLKQVADVYNHGSVIESRLTEWLEEAYKLHGQNLRGVSGAVGYTGEGEWTIKTAKRLKIPVKIIEESFKFRVSSQKNPSYTGKILSALRGQFGQHKITRK